MSTRRRVEVLVMPNVEERTTWVGRARQPSSHSIMAQAGVNQIGPGVCVKGLQVGLVSREGALR